MPWYEVPTKTIHLCFSKIISSYMWQNFIVNIFFSLRCILIQFHSYSSSSSSLFDIIARCRRRIHPVWRNPRTTSTFQTHNFIDEKSQMKCVKWMKRNGGKMSLQNIRQRNHAGITLKFIKAEPHKFAQTLSIIHHYCLDVLLVSLHLLMTKWLDAKHCSMWRNIEEMSTKPKKPKPNVDLKGFFCSTW